MASSSPDGIQGALPSSGELTTHLAPPPPLAVRRQREAEHAARAEHRLGGPLEVDLCLEVTGSSRPTLWCDRDRVHQLGPQDHVAKWERTPDGMWQKWQWCRPPGAGSYEPLQWLAIGEKLRTLPLSSHRILRSSLSEAEASFSSRLDAAQRYMQALPPIPPELPTSMPVAPAGQAPRAKSSGSTTRAPPSTRTRSRSRGRLPVPPPPPPPPPVPSTPVQAKAMPTNRTHLVPPEPPWISEDEEETSTPGTALVGPPRPPDHPPHVASARAVPGLPSAEDLSRSMDFVVNIYDNEGWGDAALPAVGADDPDAASVSSLSEAGWEEAREMHSSWIAGGAPPPVTTDGAVDLLPGSEVLVDGMALRLLRTSQAHDSGTLLHMQAWSIPLGRRVEIQAKLHAAYFDRSEDPLGGRQRSLRQLHELVAPGAALPTGDELLALSRNERYAWRLATGRVVMGSAGPDLPLPP